MALRRRVQWRVIWKGIRLLTASFGKYFPRGMSQKRPPSTHLGVTIPRLRSPAIYIRKGVVSIANRHCSLLCSLSGKVEWYPIRTSLMYSFHLEINTFLFTAFLGSSAKHLRGCSLTHLFRNIIGSINGKSQCSWDITCCFFFIGSGTWPKMNNYDRLDTACQIAFSSFSAVSVAYIAEKIAFNHIYEHHFAIQRTI